MLNDDDIYTLKPQGMKALGLTLPEKQMIQATGRLLGPAAFAGRNALCFGDHTLSRTEDGYHISTIHFKPGCLYPTLADGLLAFAHCIVQENLLAKFEAIKAEADPAGFVCEDPELKNEMNLYACDVIGEEYGELCGMSHDERIQFLANDIADQFGLFIADEVPNDIAMSAATQALSGRFDV